jgi:hypothetical protein
MATDGTTAQLPREARQVTGRTGGSYDAETRRKLQAALHRGGELDCPACGARLVRQRVEPGDAVSYVRRRVLLICPSCRRTASLDGKR